MSFFPIEIVILPLDLIFSWISLMGLVFWISIHLEVASFLGYVLRKYELQQGFG
jgi:hypothetical protein